MAHGSEAVRLREAGVKATFLLLSAALPEESEAILVHGFEAVVCTRELVEALAWAAERVGRAATVHVKVDTGMGRTGTRPDEVAACVEDWKARSGLRVRGTMSHFPRADEADKRFS